MFAFEKIYMDLRKISNMCIYKLCAITFGK